MGQFVWKQLTPTVVRATDYGAVGDNATDSAPGINKAIAVAQTYGGATVLLPQGKSGVNTYLCNSPITASGGVRLLGENINVTLKANSDIALVTLDGARVALEHLTLIGFAGINPANDALTIKSTAIDPIVHHCLISGGRRALNDTGSDTHVDACKLSGSYGDSVIYTTGGYYRRNKVDQSWPVSTPPSHASFNAWAATTAYTLGTVVSTQGYYIQCSTAGTSGGSAPTLQPYGVAISDGTAQWQLVGATTYYGMKVDNSSANFVEDCDFTGSYLAGLALTGTTSNSQNLRDNIFGACISAGILDATTGGSAREGFSFINNQITNCIKTGNVAINLGVLQSVDVISGLIFGCDTGVGGSATGRGNWAIRGAKIFGASTAAIDFPSGITDVIADGCRIGSSSSWGANAIAVRTAGTTDFYIITNNLVHGATVGVSDGASGTHKTVTGNQ